MIKELRDLKIKIENLADLIDSNPDELYDENFYELQSEFEQIKDYPFNNFDLIILKNVEKHLKEISNDIDLYDEQGERESMFPNGEDE